MPKGWVLSMSWADFTYAGALQSSWRGSLTDKMLN